MVHWVGVPVGPTAVTAVTAAAVTAVTAVAVVHPEHIFNAVVFSGPLVVGKHGFDF